MERLTDKENLRKENLIVDTLWEHNSIDNCVQAEELCNILRENGYNVKTRSINAMITKIKLERKIPLCYIRGKGYFWGRKREDIALTVRDLRLMINSLKEHAEFLESFIIE